MFFKSKPLLLSLLLSGKFSEPLKLHSVTQVVESRHRTNDYHLPGNISAKFTGGLLVSTVNCNKNQNKLVFFKVPVFFHCRVTTHIADGRFLELNFTHKTRHISWRPRCYIVNRPFITLCFVITSPCLKLRFIPEHSTKAV